MIGQTIAHYRILERLGQGGMGVVYRAEDTRLGRPVALKFLPAELARDVQALQRFQREARAASAMNHPNVCVIHDIGHESGQDFIVMELLEGQTLETLLRGQLPVIDRVLDLARQIADALDAAHAKGIVHRDIKPSNVFVTTRGQAKVMDFGIAKLLPAAGAATPDSTMPFGATQTALTGAGITVGTTPYMSPEQLEGKEVDLRSDLFSFGALLYEMSTGVHPFAGSSPASTVANILTAEPASLAERVATAPPELDRIVRKCLRKKPDQRYQSTRDLLLDLENLKHESTEQPVGRELAPESTGSLLAVVSQRFGLASRRWWEMNHMFAILAYPAFAYVAWYLSQLLPQKPGWWAALFSVFIVCTAITATLRLYFVVTAAFSPQALVMEVRRWSWVVRWASSAFWAVFSVHCILLLEVRPGLSAFLLAISLGGLIAADMAEPTIERHAFPQAFTPKQGASLAAEREQRLGRLMAGAQFFLAGLFVVAAFGLSKPAQQAVAYLANPLTDEPALPLVVLWGGFVLSVLLAIVWTVTAIDMWRRPVEWAGTFRRWMLYFMLPDVLAVMVGFVGFMRLKLTENLAMGFLVLVVLLGVPFGQVIVASHVTPGRHLSTRQLIMPWLKWQTPEDASKPK